MHYTYIHSHNVGFNDTAHTRAETYEAPKELTKVVAIGQSVSTRYLHLERKFRSLSKDRSSHSIQLQIPPSSPLHSIIGDLQWFRMVPTKSLRSNVSVPGSLILFCNDLFTEILPGHHFAPWRCWVLTSAALVSKSYKLLLYIYIHTHIRIHIYTHTYTHSCI